MPYRMTPSVRHRAIEVHYTEHCSVGSTNLLTTITARSVDEKGTKDFYGGWTGPLEKFYLFIFYFI